MTAETIFALSSGALPSAVAILRLSGSESFTAVRRLLRGPLPPARGAALRSLYDPGDGALLDRGLVLLFPAPASFTGEDVAELHVTGGAALVERLLALLGSMEGLRLAEPGEFARRALAAGKMDLTEAEGLAALIDAETETQRQQAMMAAGGHIRRQAEEWRARLLDLRADAEAELDFGEAEEDVALQVRSDAELRIGELARDIEQVLLRYGAARRIRRGVTIAVVGPPNAGKSSLVNALSRSEAAIVSNIPGTTRDALEVPLDVFGYRATLVDTAGLREAADAIEAEGVRRALARAEDADLVLRLGSHPHPPKPNEILVHSKADIDPPSGASKDCVAVSAHTGDGLETLLHRIADRLKMQAPGEALAATSARQQRHLRDTAEMLRFAAEEVDPVLRAEHLRQAGEALSRLTGNIETEEMLGAVFSRFCVGK